jgi:hypothetical protein
LSSELPLQGVPRNEADFCSHHAATLHPASNHFAVVLCILPNFSRRCAATMPSFAFARADKLTRTVLCPSLLLPRLSYATRIVRPSHNFAKNLISTLRPTKCNKLFWRQSGISRTWPYTTLQSYESSINIIQYG